MTNSSLIVVSNRLPFVLKRRDDNTLYRKPSAGGLVTAVAPVMVQSGGKSRYMQIHLNKFVFLCENNRGWYNGSQFVGYM